MEAKGCFEGVIIIYSFIIEFKNSDKYILPKIKGIIVVIRIS